MCHVSTVTRVTCNMSDFFFIGGAGLGQFLILADKGGGGSANPPFG